MARTAGEGGAGITMIVDDPDPETIIETLRSHGSETRTYKVICHRCGCESPESPLRATTAGLAFDIGWRLDANGQPVCKLCFEELTK